MYTLTLKIFYKYTRKQYLLDINTLRDYILQNTNGNKVPIREMPEILIINNNKLSLADKLIIKEGYLSIDELKNKIIPQLYHPSVLRTK